MAYIYWYSLIHGLLEVTLQVEDSVPGCFSLLRKRCIYCLPSEQHLSERLASEIERLASQRQSLFACLRYHGVRQANHSAYELVSVFKAKYLKLRDWINLYGNRVSYQGGI